MYKGERFNTITHFAGSVAALIGLVVLIVMASHQGDTLSIVSVTIYGSTLILLYVASTLYHGFRGKAKKSISKTRLFRNLSPDCRNLHTICLSYSGGGTGLGYILYCLEPGNFWNTLGIVFSQRKQTCATDYLSSHGLDDYYSHQAIDSILEYGRFWLVTSWRFSLYLWGYFLCLR